MTNPPISQQITFLYTNDLARSTQFYENILGLNLWRDQKTCRIYRVSGDAYLGICQRAEPATLPAERTVIFTLVTDAVDTWYTTLLERGATFEHPPTENPSYQIYHCFLRDPDGYLIEIQRFL